MATSQRVDVTTIAEQIKGEEVNIFRDNKFLALYQEKGLITFNHRGKRECEWDLRIRINKLHAWDDGNPQNMPRVQRHVKMACRGGPTGPANPTANWNACRSAARKAASTSSPTPRST